MSSTTWVAQTAGSTITDSLLTSIEAAAAAALVSENAAAASEAAALSDANAAASSASAASSSANASANSAADANSYAQQAQISADAAQAAAIPVYTVQTVAISSGVLTLDLSAASMFLVSLNANITSLVLQNVPASGSGGVASIRFTADGTGRTITWPGTFRWGGAGPPTMSSTNGKVDWIQFITVDGGTTWDAFTNGQSF